MAWKHVEGKRAYERERYERKREEYLQYQRDYHAKRKVEDPTYRRSSVNRCNAKRAEDPMFAAAKREAERWRHIEKKYGLSQDDYWEMVGGQSGKCLICQCEPDGDLVVDHCHATGEVRGLLCRSCNSGLGCFKDSLDNLNAAIQYLTNPEKRAQSKDGLVVGCSIWSL